MRAQLFALFRKMLLSPCQSAGWKVIFDQTKPFLAFILIKKKKEKESAVRLTSSGLQVRLWRCLRECGRTDDSDGFLILHFYIFLTEGIFSLSSCSHSIVAREQAIWPVHTLPPPASSTCLSQWRKGSETERRKLSGL